MKAALLVYIFLRITFVFPEEMQFQGYHYPMPVKIARINTIHHRSDGGVAPPNVAADFVDDIIADHKKQIFASVLSGAKGGKSSLFVGGRNTFNFNRCASCTCGVPNFDRIVGGTAVQTNKYPWIAQLMNNRSQYCGATLINDRYVVTAAHCAYGMNVTSMYIRLLQLVKNSPSQGIVRKVVFINTHAFFNPGTLEHDIALLRLDRPVPLLSPIRPVCMPTMDNQNFDFQSAIVAGWGLTSDGGIQSTDLRELVVPVLTNDQCKATAYRSMILDTMLCAGYLEGGRDACQGDSGGPLIVRDRIFRLAGVVSFGYGCAQRDAPGVYTRVSKYLNWIAANTQDACYCVQ